jgi:hypothetical protein
MSLGRSCLLAILFGLGICATRHTAHADEGGVSYWLPGQFGSFAASPLSPGWSLPLAYYHLNADAGSSKQFARGGSLALGVDANANFVFLFPTYVLRDTILGGQAAVSLGWAVGAMSASASATRTGPLGNLIALNPSDRMSGGSDIYPQASLRWSHGPHSSMAYLMGGIPVGAWEKGSLANLSIHHGALDLGGAYTYFDPKRGHEASATTGFTYNFENPDTHYRNGIDSHLDWAASQFLSEQTHVGVAGYFYYQLTGDSGSGAVLGDFKSQVVGLGPQVGHFFAVRKQQWYANLKAYWEFAETNRPAGWNLWFAVVIPLGG